MIDQQKPATLNYQTPPDPAAVAQRKRAIAAAVVSGALIPVYPAMIMFVRVFSWSQLGDSLRLFCAIWLLTGVIGVILGVRAIRQRRRIGLIGVACVSIHTLAQIAMWVFFSLSLTLSQ